MKKPLTKENKKLLNKLLINNLREELEIDKYVKDLESFLEKHFINYINDNFGKELLRCFKCTRDKLRKCCDPKISINYICNLDPELSNNEYLLDINYDDKYFMGDLKDNSPEYNLRIAPVIFNTRIFSLMPNHPCPDLFKLNELKKIFFIKNSRIAVELEDFIPKDQINELLLLCKEILIRDFIIENYLRIFKYNKFGTTTFDPFEFLWNIKTWEELLELNKDWFDLLQDYLKSTDSNDDQTFNMNNKTISEILNDLDSELGL